MLSLSVLLLPVLLVLSAVTESISVSQFYFSVFFMRTTTAVFFLFFHIIFYFYFYDELSPPSSFCLCPKNPLSSAFERQQTFLVPLQLNPFFFAVAVPCLTSPLLRCSSFLLPLVPNNCVCNCFLPVFKSSKRRSSSSLDRQRGRRRKR